MNGDWTARHNVSGTTIHDATLNSASTISEKQYLLLQVLEADRLLATFQSRANYRQSFLNGPILEGTFALAKKYQSQAAVSRDESFQSRVAFSPIANRTRAKVGNLAQKMRAAQLQTPTKSTGRAAISSEVPGTPEVEDSPFQTPGPEELAPLMYPQTKDEQIVNAALVDFLNALSMHFPQASDWTLHRKSFKAVFENAAFEARTDGYLEDGGSSERVRALVEVKPMLREKKLNPIRMQEAAQMVAWIMADPDPTGALNLPGRRLHVSQDRHQISITFAEYDSSYIQYLNNRLPPNAPRPFLTMHEFGPWNTNVRSEMESIGGLLLAIALRAYADAAQPSK
ncbi:uncharacterized protein BO66DRAFT_473428 [Aspergillus aculeatinus CBS 121060]|uniref:Uncharacterized protein n=1 Tax=Aspergillus aculeatinus CBS 121060 TaxID=1448322 RepID=A0ACD1H1I6_9EURO|nr:hypothetical protein BO66DRAFT_473428 [Aspergillus aculeatinus CBS 121060]RAH67364.1 hypothetical protein BO66DRAFT_473428 [Aspergillus aculeatinus CBS 121060]